MSRRMLVVLAAVAAATGCDDRAAAGGGRAEVRLALAAPPDVRLVRVTVQPAGLLVEVPFSPGATAVTATLDVPAGRQTVTATAFAGPDLLTLTAIGSATAEILVVAGSTTTVSLTILDGRDPPGPGDRAPIITSLAAPAALASGASAQVSVAATDLDGDPLVFAWTAAPAACGAFADPAAAVTAFTAAAPGDCLLTATVTAGGKSDTASRLVVVEPVTGPVVVEGQFIPRPEVTAVTVSGAGLAAGVAVIDRAAANVGPPLEGGAAVAVEVAWPTLPVPVAVTLADTCTATTYLPVARTAGAALDLATFGWTLPVPPAGASLACGLTATVTVVGHPTLADAFAIAVEVGPAPPPACALAAPVLSVGLGPQGPIGTSSPPFLTWADVAGETGYEIARSFSAAVAPEPYDTAPQDATGYLDTGLIAPAPGAYCYGCAYAVRAVAPPCASDWSNVALAPSSPPIGPGGPGGPGSPP